MSADILVVVSEKSSIQNLDKHEVKRIFLNKTRFFSNGQKVQVVESGATDVKNTFYSRVTQKSKSQLRSYWAKQIFTGKGKRAALITLQKIDAEKYFDLILLNHPI